MANEDNPIPPPATPYLFIPKDDSARPGNEKDTNSVGWITGPAIFLINEENRRFEYAARYGVKYRILVALGNAGAVPAQQVFVEFNVGPAPIIDGTQTYSTDPVELLPWSDRLGVAALSVPQSINSRSLAWSLSPKLHCFKWQDDGPVINDPVVIVRIGDPVHDRAPNNYWSSMNRHTAFRAVLPNISGTWEGVEEEVETGKVVGSLKFEFSQDWSVVPSTLGPNIPVVTGIIREAKVLPDRPVHLGQSFTDSLNRDISFRLSDGNNPNYYWFAGCSFPDINDSIEMVIGRVFMNTIGEIYSKTLLRRTLDGTPPPDVDRNLLSKIRLDRSPTWPASRLHDFEIVQDAINNL